MPVFMENHAAANPRLDPEHLLAIGEEEGTLLQAVVCHLVDALESLDLLPNAMSLCTDDHQLASRVFLIDYPSHFGASHSGGSTLNPGIQPLNNSD